MPKHDKHQHSSKFQPRHQHQEQVPQDDSDGTVDAAQEKWNPTPEVFQAFLERDYALCIQNVDMLMGARRAPMSARELKDQTLHSSDVIEKVLAFNVGAGLYTEAKGKYSLVTT